MSFFQVIYNSDMKLIIALGNPEKRYDKTRHNIGFFIADHLVGQWHASWQKQKKFHAITAEYVAPSGQHVIIAKPTTYYNLVGESARAISDFYKIAPEDTLIIHDDLALPLGTVRTRIGGSSGGNNGLKSLTSHLGETTCRLRIGVWDDTHEGREATDVVLGKLSAAEQQQLAALLPKVTSLIDAFLAGDFAVTTHREA